MRRVSDDHYVACHHPLVPVEEAIELGVAPSR